MTRKAPKSAKGSRRKPKRAAQSMADVVWIQSGTSRAGKSAASAAAAILTGEPATAENAPDVLRSGYAKRTLAQRVDPISYREIGPFHHSSLAIFDPVIGSRSPRRD
jgi:hypothetical protein